MKSLAYTLLLGIINPVWVMAQFPPAAGEEGTTALKADSSIFINWAITCEVDRGLRDLSMPDSGFASVGIPLDATNPADQLVISLGDGGKATLTFEYPIRDGVGWDFAVFENGFRSGNAYFLELAFVEVSSDGENFVRFPASSLTNTGVQIGTFDLLEPTQLNNFAGKYVGGYGVPFDLNELTDSSQLDLERITHVRVIDVVGNIDPEYRSLDKDGNPVNDPWPTNFPSSGFDLDAVGVIHENRVTSTFDVEEAYQLNVFPNPVIEEEIRIQWDKQYKGTFEGTLFDLNGRLLTNLGAIHNGETIEIGPLSERIYWIHLRHQDHQIIRSIIKVNE